MHGKNAEMEEKAKNFLCVVRTYDKQAVQLLSANIGGPGERWMRRMDAGDRQPCILETGDENELVRKRMEEAIKRCLRPNLSWKCRRHKGRATGQADPF